jgi:DNA replication and repair protein RecF
MHIQQLTLQNYRNYEHQSVSFEDGVNVFIGENAQGKTNVLESIYLLAIGKSHRTNKDSDLVRQHSDEARIDAVIQREGRTANLSMVFGQQGKKASVNGILQSKMTDFIGHFQVVLFAPEDLQLVKGGPGLRRRFIDMELGQTQPAYLYHLSHYQRALQQRNVLLKQGMVDEILLDSLDEQLVEHGVQVLLRRSKFIRDIAHLADEVYGAISADRESLTVTYTNSIPGLDEITDANMTTEAFIRGLRTKRGSDRQIGYTSIGPHRDDMVFHLNGQAVQSFASQGQQRTIALSLRLAEIDFIYREIHEYPVLLLDDVLSELDDMRQTNLVLSMSKKVQTIITATSLFQLDGKLDQRTRRLHVRSGIISPEG